MKRKSKPVPAGKTRIKIAVTAESFAEFRAWALSRIEECRREEIKFPPGSLPLALAVQERITLTAALRTFGVDVEPVSDEFIRKWRRG